MPTDRFSGLILGTNLAGTDNADGTLTIDATGGGGTVGYGTSLPGSPSDGDEYILVDSTTAATYAWRFRYNASGGTYKWEFIGGTYKTVEVAASQTTSSSTYGNLTTSGPSFTIPVAGVYRLELSAQMIMYNNGNSALMAVKLGSAATSDTDAISFAASANNYANIFRQIERTLAASDVLLCQYRSGVNTQVSEYARRVLSVIPIKVG